MFYENGLGKLGLVGTSIAVTGLCTLSISQFADSSCPALVTLGHPCPFCGLTRAFTEFVSLNNSLEYLSIVNVTPLLLLGFIIILHLVGVLSRKKFLSIVPIFSVLLISAFIFRYFVIFDEPLLFAVQ